MPMNQNSFGLFVIDEFSRGERKVLLGDGMQGTVQQNEVFVHLVEWMANAVDDVV